MSPGANSARLGRPAGRLLQSSACPVRSPHAHCATPKIVLRSKCDSDAKVLGMNSHPWGEPESAVSELLETIPDLWACVDRALARAFAGMASADLAGARRAQAEPDVFRAALVDEFSKAGACVDEQAATNRNSVVLRPPVETIAPVIIHVVKQPGRGLLPSAASRARRLEIEDSTLFGIGESLGCELVCLYITWEIVDDSVELFLSMPRSTASSNGYTDATWQVRIPDTLGREFGAVPAEIDIDPGSDLDGFRLRQDEVGNGDDSA